MTNTNTMNVTSNNPVATNETLFSDNFATLILNEVSQSVRKSKAKYPSVDTSELESFLVSEIFNVLVDKPSSFTDIRMVRRLCNTRTINFVKGVSRGTVNQSQFITSVKDEDGQDVAILDTLGKADPDMELKERIAAFRSSLTERQNSILDMIVAGYSNNEICEKLHVSINTPNNTMKKIRQLAVEFGLEL